jgi:hypothetical protein
MLDRFYSTKKLLTIRGSPASSCGSNSRDAARPKAGCRDKIRMDGGYGCDGTSEKLEDYRIARIPSHRFANPVEKPDKQSPLRTKPRRAAGQSLQEQINDTFDDLLKYLVVGMFSVVLLSLELWRWLWPTPPSPVGAAIGCLLVIGWSAYRVWVIRAKLRDLKLGRDGERIVGEKLEQLRASDYRVFHDMLGGDFNLDHVIVGPGGVFVIETKTWRKSRGETIESDGEFVWKGGVKLNPNPIEQAKAQARWLSAILKEVTNQSVFVQPVVVFPGWWVRCKVPEPKVWVLNPDQIEGVLKGLPKRLEEKDAGLIGNRMELLVRQA